MSRHDEPKMIEVFWKKIIANGSILFLNPTFKVQYKISYIFLDIELEKVNKPDMKPSDLKAQLADNIVNIAKEYVDDEKYFPLGKNYNFNNFDFNLFSKKNFFLSKFNRLSGVCQFIARFRP